MDRTISPRRLLALLVTLIALSAFGCAGGDSDSVAATTTEATDTTTAPNDPEQELCNAPTYTVEYPERWSINSAADGDPCEWFHPEPFEIPPASEAVGIAIHLRYDDVDFEFVTDPANNSDEVLDRRESAVDGRPAIRMHTRSTGEGLLDRGVESVTWFVDFESQVFTGATHGVAPGGIEGNGPVLDEMMDSLRFKRQPEGPPESVS